LASKPSGAKMEHIRYESIDNLTMKRVVCPNVVQNVGTTRKHQNGQVSTQRFPTFWGGGYSSSIESFSVNENDVPSLPNLEDMH